jgi:hypothetical protein
MTNRKEYYKQYQQDNKEKISSRKKIWYENNREILKEYYKNYQQANKEKIAEYNKTKRAEIFLCECGGKYSCQHKTRHERTKKHLIWLDN